MNSKFCILFLTFGGILIGISGYNDTNWIKHYSRTNHPVIVDAVTEPLYNVLPYEHISYTEANISFGYKSSAKFYSIGMNHLYTLTEKFMSVIKNDEALPNGFIDVAKDGDAVRVVDVSKEWLQLVKHYGPILIIVTLAVIFIIAMPTIGLTFCCCRCVGRCGARSQLYDKRYDPCRRLCYGVLLSVIAISISFGVVCTFTTNELLEEGVTSFPDSIRDVVNDTNLYLNNAKKEVNTLLITNYNELQKSLFNILESSGQIVLTKLSHVSKANVLLNLTTIVNGLALVKTDLKKLDNTSKQLLHNALQLSQGLKESRETLIKKLEICSTEPVCIDLSRNFDLNDLKLESSFTRLPNLTVDLQNLSELIASDINNEVDRGRQHFNLAKMYVQMTIEKYIEPVQSEIRNIGKSLSDIAHHIVTSIDKIQGEISKISSPVIEHGEGILNQYSPYRHYIGLNISIVLLIILSCLGLGLMCGFCGSRANSGYQDDCCNKGAGSRCLMIAVWLMFMSSSFLMAVALIYFMAGISTDTIVCQTLNKSGDNSLFSILDKIVDVNKYYTKYAGISVEKPIHLSDIIQNCHRNHSLYEVLEIEKYMDITELANYPKRYNIQERVDDIVRNIRLDREITIITPEAQTLLKKLAKSSLNDIDLSPYTHVFDNKITTIDLMQLAEAINETAQALPSNLNVVKLSLLNHVLFLKTYQDHLVPTMINLSKEMELIARQIQEHLRFNHTSLKKAVEHVLSDVEDAQVFLNTDGRIVITQLAKEFGEEFIGHLEDYLHRIVSHTRSNVARCWPISQAYNATVVSVCNRILSPFNGFWMSLGSVLLLFIPALILSIWLSDLYQKSDGYLGPLVEVQWDQHAETSVAKPATDFQRNVTTSAVTSSPFKNTEYERPPPYYYPKRASVLQTDE